MKSMIKVIIISCLCLIALPLLVHAQRATSSSASGEGRCGGLHQFSREWRLPVLRNIIGPFQFGRLFRRIRQAFFRIVRILSTDTVAEAGSAMPSLRGTSFYSYGTYFQWQDFLFRSAHVLRILRWTHSRFLRNSEPLLTPRLASLAARRPLAASAELIRLGR